MASWWELRCVPASCQACVPLQELLKELLPLCISFWWVLVQKSPFRCESSGCAGAGHGAHVV